MNAVIQQHLCSFVAKEVLPVVQEREIAVSCYEDRFLKRCFPPIRQQMSKKETWPKAFRETGLEIVFFRNICLPKSQETAFDSR